MIFVTVGAQMPFDRLVKTVDQWASTYGRNDIFAQIGKTDYKPISIQWAQFLKPEEFKQRYEAANVIVAHAGTGSIITALQLGKPILIMPRHASLRETRNDHQISTSKYFGRYDSVVVAWDENDLFAKLNDIENLYGTKILNATASSELVREIRSFIIGEI